MRVWKITPLKMPFLIEKAMKAITPETINSCWRKQFPDTVHDFIELITETIKEIMNGIVDVAKR